MKQIYKLILGLLTASITVFAQNERATSCEVYFDPTPLYRTTSMGEENVVSAVYQAVAQRYNGMSGAINSVDFWGRVNPAANVATQNIKVVIYQSTNLNLPGGILTQFSVTVDSSSTPYLINAPLPTPLTVSGNIIIAIQPTISSTDNFFVSRNVEGNGANTNLSLVKQGNVWYNDLTSNLGPEYDIDFMIFPVVTKTVTSNFTFSTTAADVSFTNTSSGATSYLWDFGDGTTSTVASPTHTYTENKSYQVSLTAYQKDTSCHETLTKSVTITITGTGSIKEKANFLLLNPVINKLVFSEPTEGLLEIFDITGNKVISFNHLECNNNFKVDDLKPGVYFARVAGQKPLKFVKVL